MEGEGGEGRQALLNQRLMDRIAQIKFYLIRSEQTDCLIVLSNYLLVLFIKRITRKRYDLNKFDPLEVDVPDSQWPR